MIVPSISVSQYNRWGATHVFHGKQVTREESQESCGSRLSVEIAPGLPVYHPAT